MVDSTGNGELAPREPGLAPPEETVFALHLDQHDVPRALPRRVGLDVGDGHAGVGAGHWIQLRACERAWRREAVSVSRVHGAGHQPWLWARAASVRVGCVRSADAGASRSSQPWSRRCSATLLRLTVGRWCDKLANESAEAAVGSHVGGFKGCRVLLYAFSKAAEKGRLGVPSFEGRLLVLTHTLCSSPAVVTCKTPVTTMAAGAAKLEVSWGLKWGQSDEPDPAQRSKKEEKQHHFK